MADLQHLTEDDLNGLADDDLGDMISAARAEQRRRKEEKKLPVFAVDGCYYKSLVEALKELEHDVQHALNFKGGKPEEFLGDYLTDGVERTKFGLRIVFWSESEYSSRPDRVWGAPQL